MDKKNTMLYPLTKPLVELDLQFFAHPSYGTYDAKLVTVIVGGVEITGFAEGTFVISKKVADAVKEHVSPQGDVAFAIVNNSLGEIKITLNQTSPAIPYLNEIATTNKIVPVWVHSDNQVKEKSGGTYGMIKVQPEAGYSGEITSREYVFFIADYTLS
ncbi:MAG: DUF3277 domain-containing protein [Kurthia sp.]